MVSWLITSIDPHDDDHRFGLANLSLAFSALGWMSLAELTALRVAAVSAASFRPCGRRPISVT
ncbi:DUF2958 domain-containing protein [Acidovorax sp. SUPP950]|uniref:DUF2958 domain-containing protein n=1 Tax=Acidovorax sp. SUPP950 TaxID=511901 RepID=UPI0032E9C759